MSMPEVFVLRLYCVCTVFVQSTLEEVDVVASGANYGWSQCEGVVTYSARNNDVTRCDGSNPSSPFTTPKLTYSHAYGNAVIGGFIYRASRNACIQVSTRRTLSFLSNMHLPLSMHHFVCFRFVFL